MAGLKITMVNQLMGLQCYMMEHTRRIETGVDRLENGKATRDVERKEILLPEHTGLAWGF